MGSQESFKPEKPHHHESIDPEKVHIAENFLQLYYANKSIDMGKVLSPIVADESTNLSTKTEELSAEFRAWFNSEEGMLIIDEYVTKHGFNEIGHFDDMDKLVELFEAYRTRTLH